MIDAPQVINAATFQHAWIAAARHLRQNHWVARNLVVQIADPTAFEQPLHDRISRFARRMAVLGPKHVAYTIFPHGLHAKCATAAELYAKYNRPNGLCRRLVRRSSNRWGTYFQRLTAYETLNGTVNQLDKIIAAIRSDPNTFSAAFAMVIQKPGGDTTRRLGGPCLNYVAVQLDAGPPLTLGLLCTYRNHDFLERAYGNYWGLSNLLRFMAVETGAHPGPLTCISSRAFVDKRKNDLKSLLDSLP
jgi:hypothetical protein